jgi:hypothetical protein
MAWSANWFGFQSSTSTLLPQLLDRVRHREATKQSIISMSSTLRIVTDLQLMRVPPLGLDLLIVLTRRQALVTVIALQ